MEIILVRFAEDNKQTLSRGIVINDDGTIEFNYACLELPWLDNTRRISCIAAGKYKVKKRWSPRFKNHFHIQNVPGRSYILMHSGNFNHNTLGCQLPGASHTDINNDGFLDVTRSKKTMKALWKILPKKFFITIINIKK